jgi:hypothetical protein
MSLHPDHDLPLITLWQPYASLIFAGVKLHETRHWAYPERLRGARIVIHAAKAFAPRAVLSPELRELCGQTFGCGWETHLPRGAALGTVQLIGCHETESLGDAIADTTQEDRISGNFDPGRYAWRLANARAYPTPILYRGAQKWGRFKPAIETFA